MLCHDNPRKRLQLPKPRIGTGDTSLLLPSTLNVSHVSAPIQMVGNRLQPWTGGAAVMLKNGGDTGGIIVAIFAKNQPRLITASVE